jgi:hypothetical protein
MSYEEVLETQGDYRVKLVLDEGPAEPEHDGQSPLLRLDRGGYDSVRAEHIMATGRPLDDDDQIEYAARHWDTTPADRDWRLFETYLRAWYGVTQIETWHSGSYWYVTYDSAAWREYAGTEPGSADMAEYRAWCEGEVFGVVLEKRVHWSTEDPDFDDEDRWEEIPDGASWGYYGYDWAVQCAKEALAGAVPKPRTIIHDDGSRWTLHLNGDVQRHDVPPPYNAPSGQWTVTGAVTTNNFGHVTRYWTLAEILDNPRAIPWKYKNRKQRTFIRDIDHGHPREWVSPGYRVE